MRTRQEQVITELGVQPTIDPEVEVLLRREYLKEALAHSGINGFVLGISGGQDSLLASILAQQAVTEHRDATGENASFHAMLLPYGIQADRNDALLACETIKPDYVWDLDIKPAVDAFAESYETATGAPLPDFHKGNAKARERMIAQYAVAGAHGLLVVGTDHAAEAITGFFTKFGDGGADIVPLAGLNKRQGRDMLRVLGAPTIFVTKPPTADLLDAKPGQTDETELGVTYDQIDDYLEGKDVPEHVARFLEERYDTTIHKRTVPAAYTDTLQ